MKDETLKSETNFFIYIVRCADTTLYTGMAIDIQKRVHEHNNTNRGAKYTKERRPVKLVYNEGPYTRSEAAKREYAIKRLSKAEKERLIK